MIRYLKGQYVHCSILICLGLVVALLSIFQGIMLQVIVDTAVGNIKIGFTKILLLVVIYVIINFSITYLYKCNLYNVTTKSIKQMKDRMLSSFIVDDLENKTDNTMDFLAIMEKDTTQIFEKYLINFFYLINMTILFISASIYLFYIDILLTIVVLVTGAVSILLPQVFIFKARVFTEQYLKINKIFFHQIKEVIYGLSVINIFGLENKMGAKVKKTNEELEKAHKKQLYQQALIECLSNSSGFLVLACNVIFAGYLSYRGYFTIGTVLAIMQVMNFVMIPLSQIPRIIVEMKSVKPAIDNINKFISPELLELAEPVFVSAEIRRIELSNVWLEVPGQDTCILKDINCIFEKNKKYVIVGLSGSGKSTFLKLIAGFYNKYKGNIIINEDKYLCDYSKNEWKKVIAVLEQNVFLFNDSIKNNICFETEADEQKLNNLLNTVGLKKFIEEREGGINSMLGEDGEKISGGEKQRLALARAFYKDAPILLADEPTSGLDATNAYLIEKMLLNCKKMVIHVTHKLEEENLKQYDSIICMEKGKIVGCGDFYSLISKNEYFQKLYQDYKYSLE